MLRSVFVAAAAAMLLAVGALSATAGNSQGKVVSTPATGTTLKGDAIGTLASAKGEDRAAVSVFSRLASTA